MNEKPAGFFYVNTYYTSFKISVLDCGVR